MSEIIEIEKQYPPPLKSVVKKKKLNQYFTSKTYVWHNYNWYEKAVKKYNTREWGH